jgi:hypothetical protein
MLGDPRKRKEDAKRPLLKSVKYRRKEGKGGRIWNPLSI